MRTLIPAAILSLSVASIAAAETVDYTVQPGGSSVTVHVGKSGVFSFAGHRHQVDAPVSGTIRADAASLAASSVDLRFATASLRVRPEGEPKGDAPKVQEVMHGPKVLDVARFPEVRFVSKAVRGQAAGAAYDLVVVGALTLRGVTRDFTVPVRVTVDDRRLTASGQLTLRHDQFGMKPVSAAAGAIKVANELRVEFTIVGERR